MAYGFATRMFAVSVCVLNTSTTARADTGGAAVIAGPFWHEPDVVTWLAPASAIAGHGNTMCAVVNKSLSCWGSLSVFGLKEVDRPREIEDLQFRRVQLSVATDRLKLVSFNEAGRPGNEEQKWLLHRRSLTLN